MLTDIILEVFTVASLSVVGIIAITKPELVQRIATTLPMNPWKNYVASTAYLRNTRLIGVLAMAMAALLAVDLIVKWLTR